MFTRDTLELLDDLVKGESISDEDRARLQRIITGALWASSRHLAKRERVAVEEAEREGKVKICGLFESGIDPETGATILKPVVKEKPSRFKPQAVAAKSGTELLGLLGIDPDDDQ